MMKLTQRWRALTSMLEPMLMIFLGITVGFVIIAMYMPIFQMGSAVRR